MNGAPLLLLVVLLLYATSLLVVRFASGELHILKQPITWFYASWIIGLVFLTLPLYEYKEKVSIEVLCYITATLFSFSVGAIASIFTGAAFGAKFVNLAAPVDDEFLRMKSLIRWILIAGLIGTALLILNTFLSGSLSVTDRLNSDNAAQVRIEHMTMSESRIGPLFGVATFTSAVGGIGVAFVYYFIGRGVKLLPRHVKWLAIAVLMLNLIGAFVAFGSRMFAVFSFGIAFLAFVFGRWSIGLKVLNHKLGAKKVLTLAISSIVTLTILWFSATYFLEKRVAGQSAAVLLHKTHRADFSRSLDDLIHNDPALQYFAFSLSYFSTPIPTLAFYLDLPDERYPGPFWGQYNFPAVARWVRRAAFIPNPLFWEEARFDIFKPLGDSNYGTNVWATAVRDIIADFGKVGALVFIFAAGFLTQALNAAQKKSPTAIKAGLLAYALLSLSFSGFISTLFMPQIHWPLYFGGLLLFTRLNSAEVYLSKSKKYSRALKHRGAV